tara:strand:+ start:22409 stop:22738 length:330 start_codon:yes stop_codon:yes gene_type:complete
MPDNSSQRKIRWEQHDDWITKIKWDSNPYIWDDVRTLLRAGAAAGSGGASFDEITRDYSEKDKKKLVKLVCKVNGIKYEDEKWKQSSGKVNATQVKIAVSKVMGIKIDI